MADNTRNETHLWKKRKEMKKKRNCFHKLREALENAVSYAVALLRKDEFKKKEKEKTQQSF